MRVWKASGADPRCTMSFTRATVAPLYVAFHTPCFTSRRRRRLRSTPCFIPLATRTNGASAFPDAVQVSEPLENNLLDRIVDASCCIAGAAGQRQELAVTRPGGGCDAHGQTEAALISFSGRLPGGCEGR